MSAAQGLLDSLALHIGIERIALGPHQQCTVSFDDTLVVSFLGEEQNGLSAISYVVDVDPLHPEITRRLLGYNFVIDALGGARVAIDDASDSVVLMRRWDTTTTEPSHFLIDVERFVNLVSAIRADTAQVLEDARQGRAIENTPASLLAYLQRMA